MASLKIPDTPPATIVEAYDALPMTERTLLKHRARFPFTITNDIGAPSWWRVLVDGRELGVIVYAGGRKLCSHGIGTITREVRADG